MYIIHYHFPIILTTLVAGIRTGIRLGTKIAATVILLDRGKYKYYHIMFSYIIMNIKIIIFSLILVILG